MRRWLVLLSVLAMFASACGSRLDEAERGAGSSGGEVAAADPDTGSAGGSGSDDHDASTSSGPTDPTTESAATESDTGSGSPDMFGTVPVPCGNSVDEPLGSPTEPSGEATQGVDADSIAIAVIADPGNVAVPGLNQEMFDAMDAFTEWCNSLGGINGRQLELTQLDSALFQYGVKAEEACDFAFAVVGTGAVFDDAGAQTLVDCEMVSVPGFTLSSQYSLSARMVQPNPNPPDSYGGATLRWLAETFPEATGKGGALTANLPTTITQRDRTVDAAERLGWEFAVVREHESSEANWGPIIQNLQDEGVEILSHVGTPEETVNLLAAMDTQRFEPKVVLGPNNYDQQFLELAGELAEGVYIEGTLTPFETAEPDSATARFVEIMEEFGGYEESMLGAQAFAAGMLFATAADAIGADLTREALLAELGTIESWDTGGIFGVQNPAANTRTECGLVFQVVDGAFEQVYPEEGFDCREGNAVVIDVPYEPGASVGASDDA